MKHTPHFIAGAAAVALAASLPLTAFAQGKKASPSPAASPSPGAATTAPSPAAKSARPQGFYGNVTAVDQTAKTFSIGKTTTRVIKVTDQTTVSKGESSASFGDITEGQYVTGSYMKKGEGTLEAKSVKIGGKTGAETGPASKKAKKDDGETGDEETAAASPSPKKK